MDSSRCRMSGPISNSGSFLKQKNLACNDPGLTKEALLSHSNTVVQSGESSRRPAVSSSRDESDPYRSHMADRIPVGSSDPKRSSGRHASQMRNYDSALKGIETLLLDRKEKVHY